VSELNHTMIDIETLSTTPTSVIVTLAAVKFSFSSDATESFCVNINPRESKHLGLDISIETLDWWRKQKPEATKSWQHSQIDLSSALDMFDVFCGIDSQQKYWAQGSYFDMPIIESSYRILGRKVPWKYYNVYDTRTIFYVADLDVKTAQRVGEYHSAIDDCRTQIAWLKKSLGKQNV
jgi:hypothetical protein